MIDNVLLNYNNEIQQAQYTFILVMCRKPKVGSESRFSLQFLKPN